MANYYGSARSNYFRVKNETLFLAWAEMRKLQVLEKKILATNEMLYGLCPDDSSDDGTWPSYEHEVTVVTIEGRIMSDIDQTKVADIKLSEQRFEEIPQESESAAETRAENMLLTYAQSLPEWDERLHPYLVVDDIEFLEADLDIDIVSELQEHLADDEVAIFMAIGSEKLRYLDGYAIAFNNKGEIRNVSLDDIYKLASELGPNVTQATY